MARKTKKEKEPEIIETVEEEEVQVLEEETSGAAWDIGLMATTAFFLLAAIVMIVIVLKRDYNAGPLA